jgi:hypothetical protein
MDERGYVIGGLSFLLILPVLTLLMVLIESEQGINDHYVSKEYSDNVFAIYNDFENNIPRLSRQVFLQKSEEVIQDEKPILNSRIVLKNEIQILTNNMAQNYQNKGVMVNCTINSVSETENPFLIEINSTVSLYKNGKKHYKNLSQRISICDEKNPLPDPLPSIKCHDFGGIKMDGTSILYGHSLVSYLNSFNIPNSSIYENATAPRFIKKCPYNPYVLHGLGNYINLKNCVDNGYYHESNDGACFLCRLEGKSTCIHQGLETFIIPPGISYQSNNSAPCSVDHVIFDSNPENIYSGYLLEYYQTNSKFFYIFLDNSHRAKYGIPNY